MGGMVERLVGNFAAQESTHPRGQGFHLARDDESAAFQQCAAAGQLGRSQARTRASQLRL